MKILNFVNQILFYVSVFFIVYAIILFQVSLASALLGLLLLPFLGWEQFVNATIWKYVVEGLGYALITGIPAIVLFGISLAVNIKVQEKEENDEEVY